VLFSFQTWQSEIGFNLKDMAYELAESNRVLFVNRALDRNSILRSVTGQRSLETKIAAREKKNAIEKIQENLWVLHVHAVLESINWVPSSSLYDFLNRINNKRIAREINVALGELSFSDIIFINDNDFFRGLYQKDYLPCEKYIFYIRDFLTCQPFFKKKGPRAERQMIEKADLVVANSSYLAQYARQWNRNSFDIGQGCDLQSFASENFSVPNDLINLKKTIIGYCGAVTAMRLDIPIVKHIASSFPEYSIVLVGPADSFFEKDKWIDYPNVHLLGGKAPEQIANYVYCFDICMNPQSINQLTIGNYPRKVDEYLAAGKPVVATATEAMKMFSYHTFLCATKEDYVQQIEIILSDENMFSEREKERRKNFALQHTWKNSIGRLGDAYYQTLEDQDF